MATCRVTGQESAEAIVGAGRCRQRSGNWQQAGEEPRKPFPAEGPNTEQGRRPQAMNYRLHKLSPYLRGWMGYFGISEPYRDIPEIDGWIRRRVRMCYWKQWRRCRTKIRELLRLGTLLGTAIRAGLNRSGPWAMARRLAAQSGMTNQWLKEQGLISVKELWVKIHYPATAR